MVLKESISKMKSDVDAAKSDSAAAMDSLVKEATKLGPAMQRVDTLVTGLAEANAAVAGVEASVKADLNAERNVISSTIDNVAANMQALIDLDMDNLEATFEADVEQWTMEVNQVAADITGPIEDLEKHGNDMVKALSKTHFMDKKAVVGKSLGAHIVLHRPPLPSH